jgi:hypothetical protein
MRKLRFAALLANLGGDGFATSIIEVRYRHTHSLLYNKARCGSSDTRAATCNEDRLLTSERKTTRLPTEGQEKPRPLSPSISAGYAVFAPRGFCPAMLGLGVQKQ